MANTPAYIAYHVKDTNAGEHGEKRGVWTKVGAAWPNKDGKGYILLHMMLSILGTQRNYTDFVRASYNTSRKVAKSQITATEFVKLQQRGIRSG